MIRLPSPRLLAYAAALVMVAHSPEGQGAASPAAAATPAPVVQMDHISIETLGPARGSAVILIPGLSSPRATWDGVAAELARTHRVYLVQVNGFGGDAAGANLKPGILDGIVEDLSTVVVRDKLGAPAIVGHSMGGLVGMMFAKAHPGQVGKLMIVDSLPFIGTLFGPTATVAMVEPRAAAMRDQMAATYGKPADGGGAKAIAAGLALKPESRAKVEAWVAATDPRVSAQALYEDFTTDLRPDLKAIATPITMVYPWSATLPKERADAMYRGAYSGAPNVTFVDVGDSAHFVMLDQPAAFQAALTAFLAK